MNTTHSFHIPVMGIGFTIDTPIKVAQYGIDSAIFIGDDILLEKLRKMYCNKYDFNYTEIKNSDDDYRAKRITSYLNLVKDIVSIKFNKLIENTNNELKKYFDLLPLSSTLHEKFSVAKKTKLIDNWFKNNLQVGEINVNIMTKLDKVNYTKKEALPVEYNDAHAALRGYANSDLNSSVVFSAGMNPRLYGYISSFDDFFPNKDGEIKKKVILKVSDYRSALVQGKFLAKKGIWVSEFRIESGLNCGGHAFATEGHLMGPILEEFKQKKEELSTSVFEVLVEALKTSNRVVPQKKLQLRVTAQGGVGTAEEHNFIISKYNIDSVGWGTPFLLVPEATNVDKQTIEKLSLATEKDLYLSNISPLGVPFNNLRGNSKDIEKLSFADKGRPGSSCPKQYLVLNKEFTEKAICTASRQYQHLKVKELDKMKVEKHLSKLAYEKELSKITEKSCICVGLGTSALKVNKLPRKVEGDTVSICPGPNMAYYSKISSLKSMLDHIYGRQNLVTDINRPNIFIKELSLYVNYFKQKINSTYLRSKKDEKYLINFSKNLSFGIKYYTTLFNDEQKHFIKKKNEIINKLEEFSAIINKLSLEI